MMATRLVTKKNNIGNLISTCNYLTKKKQLSFRKYWIFKFLFLETNITFWDFVFIGTLSDLGKKQYLNAIDGFFPKYGNWFTTFVSIELHCLHNIFRQRIDWKLFFMIAIPAGN